MKKKTCSVKFEAKEGGGGISGYASTWTREPDSYGDIVARGAFAESIERIKAEGAVLPFLWNHNSGDLKDYIGTVVSLEEDDHGLKFEADFDDTPEAQRARELAMDGRLCKFSFAYEVLEEGAVTLDDGRKVNELRKLNIHEVSLVMYPANPDTGVVEVKAAEPEEKTGRRNSAKDADDMRRVTELLGEAQSIINSLLADEDEPEEETEAKSEEPDKVNDEEQMRIKGLIEEAETILAKGV